MIITAKFNGLCAECGGPMPKGSDIDYSGKKARHVECAPAEIEEAPSSYAIDLAERLGYEPGCETIRADWFLWDLHHAD